MLTAEEDKTLVVYLDKMTVLDHLMNLSQRN